MSQSDAEGKSAVMSLPSQLSVTTTSHSSRATGKQSPEPAPPVEVLDAPASAATCEEDGDVGLGSASVKIHQVPLKSIESDIFHDQRCLWRRQGKWPVILDESEKVAVFLHFQNAIPLDVSMRHEMEDPCWTPSDLARF